MHTPCKTDAPLGRLPDRVLAANTRHMHQISAWTHCLGVATDMSDYLERGENKGANVTHSFGPIIKLLALCIGEYRGRGVIFAVFRHSCVVVAVVDGETSGHLTPQTADGYHGPSTFLRKREGMTLLYAHPGNCFAQKK